MVEYNKVNIKLTDTQLKMLKTALKNKTGTTRRISLKILSGVGMIYLMNYYWQQDKKRIQEMHLITIIQLI